MATCASCLLVKLWLQCLEIRPQDGFRMELRRSKTMSLFPMFLKLDGRHCLVVGAGKVAESKIRSLLLAGATVRVVAPAATTAVSSWAEAGVLVWEQRPFES